MTGINNVGAIREQLDLVHLLKDRNQIDKTIGEYEAASHPDMAVQQTQGSYICIMFIVVNLFKKCLLCLKVLYMIL